MKPKSGDKEDEDGDDQDDHFEGDPRPMPYDFEKELINNSNKHIRISEVFGPPNIGIYICVLLYKLVFYLQLFSG